MTSRSDSPRYIVAEGDVPKIEPTLRYFSELRASLKNGLDVTSDLSLDIAALFTYLDAIEKAYMQACTNLATIRPSGIEGATIGDDAQRYHDALLAGWGGIEGWDEHDMVDGPLGHPEAS